MYPARPGSSGNIVVERVLIAVGGALITIAPYLPWLHVVIFGDFNLTGLLSAAHGSVAVAYVVSAVGVALVLVALLARSMEAVRIAALVSGSVILLAGGYATYGLIRAVSGSAGLGQVGVGPIMAVIGGVLLVVPPLVGYAQRPPVPFVPGRPRWRSPQWLPAAVAVCIGVGVAWSPYHAGVNNYCGTAVGATFKNPQPLPADTPPAAVAAQLQQDQTAVSTAQTAVNAQQQSDAQATQQQNAADTLSSQAQQADTKATDLEATMSGDQGTVSGDQGTVSGDQATVTGDQATMQGDQRTIASDQTTIQTDQQTLTSDQQAGNDTTFDEQQLANDQQTLANDQTTLAHDQATSTKDQHTLQTDQATMNQDQAKVAADQKALTVAQQTASQLDLKAQSAQNSSQIASSATAQNDQAAQQQLNTTQQQLTTDQQTWQDTYQTRLTSAQNYDGALASCQSQANDHFITAGVIAVVGGLLTGFLYFNRRRARPPRWPPPAAQPT